MKINYPRGNVILYFRIRDRNTNNISNVLEDDKARMKRIISW